MFLVLPEYMVFYLFGSVDRRPLGYVVNWGCQYFYVRKTSWLLQFCNAAYYKVTALEFFGPFKKEDGLFALLVVGCGCNIDKLF